MKRVLIAALALLLCGAVGMAKTNFFDALYVEGAFTLSGTSAVSFVGTTFAADMSSTVSVDGATSVDLLSAGHIDLESADIRLGLDADDYMKLVFTNSSCNLAITFPGNTPAITATATSWDWVGTTALDGTTISAILSVDDVTAASSTVTGSIHTDGGLGVAGNVYIGTDVSMVGTTGTHDFFLTDSVVDALSIQRGTTDFVVFDTSTVSVDVTGDLDVNGALVLLDGSTSVRGVSAAFTSLESPANRFGFNATEYMQIATAVTTGITTITHTGNAPTVTWTANSFDLVGSIALDAITSVGNFSVDGTTAIVDGSTSVRNVSAGFVSLEGPAQRFGYDASDYMQFAVTTGTGAVAISHTGTAPDVTWTADSLTFTGGFEVVGTSTLDDFSASGLADLDGGIAVDTNNFTVSGTTGDIATAADIDVKGSDITNTTAGGGLDLEATAAAANTATTFVEISGTTAAHATLTGTDIFLDISPTITAPTGTAADVHLIDMTFSSPVWATAVTSNLRGIYFAPTIGAATLGTNTVALIDVAAITGDDTVSLYGIRFGALTGTGSTENAIDIGAGWDAGIDSASPIVLTSASGDIDVQGEDITNSVAGGGLDFAATAAAAGTGTDFYSFEATIAAHLTNTPDDVIIEISPTLGIPTVANTVHFIESIFTTPDYATAVASDLTLWHIDPTIGNPTAGTNSLTIIDIAAIGDLDEQQNFYGIRFGNMTQEGTQVAEAFIVGTGFDAGLNTESPIILENDEILNNAADGVVTITGDDETGIDYQIVSMAHDTTGDASLTLDADAGGDDDDTWILKSVANGNAFNIIQHATTEFAIDASGNATVTGDVTVTGGDIIDGSGGGAIVANKGSSVETLGGAQKTVITFTLTGDHDIDTADGGKSAGVQVYDFPTGYIQILGALIDASVVTNAAYNANTNDQYYISVGTVDGTQAADADLTGTEADIIPKTTHDTDSAGANTQLTNTWHTQDLTAETFDGTGGGVDLYVNVAVPDANNTGSTTHAVTGTLTIFWINHGTY